MEEHCTLASPAHWCDGGNQFIESQFVAKHLEKTKASQRAKVERPFLVGKQQFGYAKLRNRSLVKNTA